MARVYSVDETEMGNELKDKMRIGMAGCGVVDDKG
jgi:hypothetical protein